tara:strand:- start:2343 stop:2576 length:234 start_codon:yes stop_codon:yes gene_type:complete
MIEYFTVLLIQYGIEANDTAPMAYVLYASEQHCQEAMDAGLAEPLYDHFLELYGHDVIMFCQRTDDVSSYMRPRARP